MKKMWVLPFLAAGLVAFVGIVTHTGQLNTLLGRDAHAAPPGSFQSLIVLSKGLGLAKTTGFAFAPDGNRIFVLQRSGEIKVAVNGCTNPGQDPCWALAATNFAVLPSAVIGDEGLIGVAFDPDYVTNKYVYFYHTYFNSSSSADPDNYKNFLVRFVDQNSVGVNKTIVFRTELDPTKNLHAGGSIAFGPDGKLYFAVGDNGVKENAQRLDNPHGKILRINKECVWDTVTRTLSANCYPSDNPFIDQPGIAKAIWAFGLRNPWRFQFDSQTGELYAGDVGWDTWEEVDKIEKGKQYGWPVTEGLLVGACPTTVLNASFCSNYVDPVYTYRHGGSGSFAIAGGPVYRGSSFPADYLGRYFFADYAQGVLRTLRYDSAGKAVVEDFDPTAGTVTDIRVAPDGSLYYLTYSGTLSRIIYTTQNHVPSAKMSAEATKGATAPFTVTFSSAGSVDPDNTPLTYLWNFGDGTTSVEANPVHVYDKTGIFSVALMVSDGTYSVQAQPLSIQVGILPTVTITSPVEGSGYVAGQTISYAIAAVDGTDFDLCDSHVEVEVLWHHRPAPTDHTHQYKAPTAGCAGSFVLPVNVTQGEADPDTWFEIRAKATDTSRLSTTVSVFIYPKKTHVVFQTEPAGLKLSLDEGVVTAPIDGMQLTGFQRQVSAISPQILNGKTYKFSGWSDGGAQTHSVTIPTTDMVYTATFTEVAPVATSTPMPTPTRIPTPTVVVSGDSLVLKPVADAEVKSESPNKNYGKSASLKADGKPVDISYMTFDLRSIDSARVGKATLRLWITNPSDNSQTVKLVDAIWTELGVMWSARPALSTVVATITNARKESRWQDVDVTSAVAQAGSRIWSIGIDTVGDDGLGFSSRETSRGPQLVIQLKP